MVGKVLLVADHEVELLPLSELVAPGVELKITQMTIIITIADAVVVKLARGEHPGLLLSATRAAVGFGLVDGVRSAPSQSPRAAPWSP